MGHAVRKAETAFTETIARFSPEYGGRVWRTGDAAGTIEGGDVLTLSGDTVLVGVSERTSIDAVEGLANRLFSDVKSGISSVIAVNMPRRRSCMHLDTLMTQVDFDSFVCYGKFVESELRVRLLRPDGVDLGGVIVEDFSGGLAAVLADGLGVDSVRFVPCGGSMGRDGLEQWDCGANVLAVRPGTVIAYDRNELTNSRLRNQGIKVIEIPSSELAMGHGGPHCMSLALRRDDI